jgi:hypothetical protein
VSRPFLVPLTALALALALAVTGCSTSAGTGSLAGAGVGALVGQVAGGTATSTLVGAGIGTGVGYLIGNEVDKADAKQRAQVTAAEMQPFAGTTWQLLSLNRPAPRPVKSLVAKFGPDGKVATTRTYEDGGYETADESYRVVGSTLIVNRPGYLINAHYRIDGDRLYLEAGDRSAVLKRV